MKVFPLNGMKRTSRKSCEISSSDIYRINLFALK